MMPAVDPRSAADILKRLQTAGVPQQGPGYALARVFARYCEIVTDRLNRAPEKNFLAYLDLLGNSLLPPQPARAPITFSLAKGATREALVPAGTQVAAAPAEGESDPVLFETDRDLTVSPVALTAALARDARTDLYADVIAVANPTATASLAAFRGDTVIRHELYLSVAQFEFVPYLSCGIPINIKVATNVPDAREVVWETWNGSEWYNHHVELRGNDETDGLKKNGQVWLDRVSELPLLKVNGISGKWIRCRWLTPISVTGPRAGALAQELLPQITDLNLEQDIYVDNSSVIAAFFNQTPIDLSKDFRPFGDRPKVGDAFNLAGPGFYRNLRVYMTLTVSQGYTVTTSGSPQVVWEYWGAAGWTALTVNTEGTSSFTKSGQITTATSADAAITTINGVTNYWIRARLVAGSYGADSSLSPPSFKSMLMGGGSSTSLMAPAVMMTCNDFVYEPAALPLVPFKAGRETSLSLGFSAPAGGSFPNRKFSMYVSAAPVTFGQQTPDNPNALAPTSLKWEYWSGAWTALAVGDETGALTRSGMLEFLGPPDFEPHQDGNEILYWIRARWEQGDYKFEPRIRHILLNTITASQTVTLRNEVLGSASGDPAQVLNTAQRPVLPAQQLQVREPDLPPADERDLIQSEEGDGAIDGTGQNIWVRWHEVPDFYASGPRDRHYVVDRLSGAVQFGDGQNGRVPPAGSNNIRLAQYRTGGGTKGNRDAGTITQLKTTLPYVNKAFNYEPALGGAEAEDQISLLERAPRAVRHGGRAVTAEDYEDLAKLASPEVARAKCVPVRDVESPDNKIIPGMVSVLVVPRSKLSKPLLSAELIRLVQEYLNGHRIATADLVVTGAPFLRVEVEATIAVKSLANSSEVATAAQDALAAFLHPLTGGAGGTGWAFGRTPRRSDLYGLLAAVAGVDHVTSLAVTETEEPKGALASGCFLVYSGNHKIALVFEG